MKWSNDEINFLMKEYPNRKREYLEQKLNRKMTTIRKKASSLKISRVNHSPKKNWRLCISKDLFYILGVLEGDGYIETNTPFKIALCSSDYEFVQEFKKSLKNIRLIKNCIAIQKERPKKRKKSFETKKLMYRIRTYSKAFIEWYTEFYNYNWIKKNCNKELYAMNFLKGIYESDGCFDRKNLRVRIACTNRDLLKLCKILYEKYNFHPTLTKGHSIGKKMYYDLNLNRNKEVILFLEKIKPVIKRRAL